MGRAMNATQSTVGADEAAEEDDDPNFIVVQLGPKFQNKIFHEFDAGFPDGEALVVAGRRVKLRYTAKVREALGSGLLERATKPPTPKPPEMADLIDDMGRAQHAEFVATDARGVPQGVAVPAAATTDEGDSGEGDSGEGDSGDGPSSTKPRTAKKP
jgi:hypothetical protein